MKNDAQLIPKNELAAHFGVSTNAFRAWGLPSARTAGRVRLYDTGLSIIRASGIADITKRIKAATAENSPTIPEPNRRKFLVSDWKLPHSRHNVAVLGITSRHATHCLVSLVVDISEI